jgi:hypothetical protein
MSSANLRFLKYCGTGYLTFCVSYSGIQGIYKGYEMANHTCFNKKNMTPTENIFEYYAYGTIIISTSFIHVLLSPIYTPISLYSRISTIF